MNPANEIRHIMAMLESAEEQIVMESAADALEDLKRELPNSYNPEATLLSIAAEYGLQAQNLADEFERRFGPIEDYGQTKAKQDKVVAAADAKDAQRKAAELRAQQDAEARKRELANARAVGTGMKKPNLTSKMMGIRISADEGRYGNPEGDFVTWNEASDVVSEIHDIISGSSDALQGDDMLSDLDISDVIERALNRVLRRKARNINHNYQQSLENELGRIYKKAFGTTMQIALAKAQDAEYDFQDDKEVGKIPTDLRQILAVMFAYSNMGIGGDPHVDKDGTVHIDGNRHGLEFTMHPGHMGKQAETLAWHILDRLGGDMSASGFMSEIGSWAKGDLLTKTSDEIIKIWPKMGPVIDAYMQAKLSS